MNKKLAVPERKKNTGQRIAMLTLSDGKTSITALEDRPILQIDKFSVGTLIQVKPQCEVRRGILMLNSENTGLVWQDANSVQSQAQSKV